MRWQYIHYGEETANKRNLEDHVGMDKKNKIINQYTHVRGMSCKWGISVSWKGEKDTSAEKKTWILSITRIKYSYVIISNPLLYIVY